MDALVSPILLFGGCVLGALGVAMALPRRGISPQVLGALLGALGLGVVYLALAGRVRGGVGLPNPNFYLFSVIMLGSALRVISHPRPVYAALYFILTILSSCGLYVLLSAEFMAAALVIVYAGAILITYLFVLMLATESPTADQVESLSAYDRYSREPIAATAVGFLLIAGLTTVLAHGAAELTPATEYAGAASAQLMPRKVETALREAGLIAADESIARRVVGGVEVPDIDMSPAEGPARAVIAYGNGQTRAITASDRRWPKDLEVSNIEGVAFTLLADHPGAIEVAGVILLMAMVGAVVLARKKVELDEAAKLAAERRSLASEFTPEHSPLMGPETPDAPGALVSGDLAGGKGTTRGTNGNGARSRQLTGGGV